MIEKRATAGVTANGRKLTGYVAKFGNATRIGGFTEIIRRGAFAASLTSGRDILAMADHDPSRILGRTKSGTLELREDDTGLAFALQMPDTQAGRDLVALAERGGKLSRTALANRLSLAEVRMGGLLSAVRRMLNVDQAAVLTVDEAGGSVDLNITLLQQQFKLPKQGGAR